MRINTTMSTILLICLTAQIPLAFGLLPPEFGPLSRGYPPVVVRNLSDHHNWPSWNRENRTGEENHTPFSGENRTDDDFHQTGKHNGSFPWINGRKNDTFPGNSDENRMHPIFPPFPKIANHTEGLEPIMRRNWTATPLPDILSGGNGLENETSRRRIERESGESGSSLGIDDNHSPLFLQENNTGVSSTASPDFTFPTPSGVFVGNGGLPLQIEDPNPPAPIPIFPPGPFPVNNEGSGFPQGSGNTDDSWLRGDDSAPRLQIEDPNPPEPRVAYPPGPFPDEHAPISPTDEHAPILPPDEHAPLSPTDDHAPIPGTNGQDPIENLPEATDNNGQPGQIGGANGAENWGLPGFPPLPAM